jgi:acyl carrier protein
MLEKVHAIWSAKLDLAEFSDDDDFFALGGHSLIMARIQAEYAAEFGIEVAMDELFRNATVRTITRYLENALQTV